MPRPKTVPGRLDNAALELLDAREMLVALGEAEHSRDELRDRRLRYLAAKLHNIDEELRVIREALDQAPRPASAPKERAAA